MKTPEEKKHELDLRYLRMARIWAENSYCERRKVGALIVKDKMIISDGYNGTPAGFENVCEDENHLTKPTYCMPKPMPSPRSHGLETTAKEPPCTSQTLLVSNAPSLSYSPASRRFFMPDNTG